MVEVPRVMPKDFDPVIEIYGEYDGFGYRHKVKSSAMNGVQAVKFSLWQMSEASRLGEPYLGKDGLIEIEKYRLHS